MTEAWTWTDAEQEASALAILERGDQITHDGKAFSVKSQSSPGSAYAVRLDGPAPTCDCEHHRNAKRPCIHILACRYFLERIRSDGTTERVRVTYKQAWGAYNRAQNAEVRLFDALLADLVRSVPEPAYKGTGRPALPLREQAFCSIQKTYSQLSSRRAASLFGFAAERGQLGHAPNWNATNKFLARKDATPILRGLLRVTAEAVASLEEELAVDSTGFRADAYGAYCADKHGQRKQHKWLKAHIISGVRTNVVVAVVITDENGADAPQLPELVRLAQEAGFDIGDVAADKAYSSRRNHEAVAEAGGVPLIPFKSNATGRAHGSPAWTKAWHWWQLNRDEAVHRYHVRSNVESTIGAVKKKMGETLKARSRVAQENELLCKFIAYNVTVLIHQAAENGAPLDQFLSKALAKEAVRL